MSALTAHPQSFRDAGLEQPGAQSKSLFVFRFEKDFGYAATDAVTSLQDSPSGVGCCRLSLLSPTTPFKVRQTAPSKGHPPNQNSAAGLGRWWWWGTTVSAHSI